MERLIPLDRNQTPKAKGTTEGTFRATLNGDGSTELLTDSSTGKEIIVPSGVSLNAFLIQVQRTSPFGFDPDYNCLPFAWSDTLAGEKIYAPYAGKAFAIAKNAGDSLGFVWAETGHKVVVEKRE